MDKINSLPKIVASRTLKSASWNAEVVNHDIDTVLVELEKQPGKNVLKYGVGELDNNLIKRGLIDEMQFLIIPIVVGNGRKAFDCIDQKSLKLDLIGLKRFDNGVISAIYSQNCFK